MTEINNAHTLPATAVEAHHALSSQVGGHPGVMTTEDGSLIIKPCLPAELDFYNSIATDDRLAPLRPFVPKMYGTLKQIDASKAEKFSTPNAENQAALVQSLLSPEGEEKETDECILRTQFRLVSDLGYSSLQSIVLENITNAFSKPATLDIKLGTVLYDDSATPEKREQMIKAAASTTSLETGVRLTGFQVGLKSSLPLSRSLNFFRCTIIPKARLLSSPNLMENR